MTAVRRWMNYLALCSLAICSLARAQAPAAQPESAAEISEQELIEFSQTIQTTIAQGDAEYLTDHLDIAAMAETVTDGIAAKDDVRKGFTEGLTENAGSALGAELVRNAQSGGSYAFLRVIKQDDAHVPLFRMAGSNGLNYHKLYVHRRPADGELAIYDIDVALTGERLTQTMRRMYIPLAIQSSGPPTPEGAEMLKAMELFGKMNAQRTEGEFKEALQTYSQIPAKHQLTKSVQVIRLACALNTSEAEYQKALTESAPLFKEDVSADLISVDVLLMQKKFDKAHAAVDRINQRVGGDPYLNVMHGGLYVSSEEYDKAKTSAAKALDQEPGLFSAVDLLLAVSLAEKDHAETARLLTLMAKEHGLQFGDLKNAQGFENFIQSPEYQTWMESKATQ